MSDPDRIEAIVVALRTLWVKYPDLRFGQLVHFIAPTPTGAEEKDIWWVDDDEWLTAILEVLAKHERS